jgi:uncharacterized protein (DUF885 family)
VTVFAARADHLLVEYFALDPVAATAIGFHAHDGRWPDRSRAGRAARIAFCERWTAELTALAEADLSPDDRVDRDVLLDALASIQFAEADLREDAWSPSRPWPRDLPHLQACLTHGAPPMPLLRRLVLGDSA